MDVINKINMTAAPTASSQVSTVASRRPITTVLLLFLNNELILIWILQMDGRRNHFNIPVNVAGNLESTCKVDYHLGNSILRAVLSTSETPLRKVEL